MIDFLEGPLRRRILFTALYVSEGAPIGFLWLALPTRFKAADVPLTEITALTAALVIPWTFKFAWAPLVDVLRTPRWTLKHWILSAQIMMGITLLPLLWANPLTSMTWLGAVLLVHATCAATQDVAIDALCISVTDAGERGSLNGWMQAGMLGGRAAMGGGALMLSAWLGDTAVVVLLIAITTFSGGMLLSSKLPPEREHSAEPRTDSGSTVTKRLVKIGRELRQALRGRTAWVGFLFALTGPACFKAFEVIIGPFLIDRGWTMFEVGRYTAIVMIGTMVLGSLVGGMLADRFSRRGFLVGALLLIVGSLTALALTDIAMQHKSGMHLPVLIATTAFGIGVFTVAMYAMFMDLTSPTLAATQFSAYMGATNGCESWSTFAIGILIASYGYPAGILTLCAISVLALPLLLLLPATGEQEGD